MREVLSRLANGIPTARGRQPFDTLLRCRLYGPPIVGYSDDPVLVDVAHGGRHRRLAGGDPPSRCRTSPANFSREECSARPTCDAEGTESGGSEALTLGERDGAAITPTASRPPLTGISASSLLAGRCHGVPVESHGGHVRRRSTRGARLPSAGCG